MTPRTRQGLIAAALAASLAAAFLLPAENPAGPARSVATKQAASPAIAPRSAFAREKFPEDGTDLFPARSWRPASPSAEAVTPAAPVAPPLPYVYTGRMEEQGHTVLFLSRQQRVLLVREGETLDGTYRVDRITPWSVEFTYLPLKQKQSLNFAQ